MPIRRAQETTQRTPLAGLAGAGRRIGARTEPLAKGAEAKGAEAKDVAAKDVAAKDVAAKGGAFVRAHDDVPVDVRLPATASSGPVAGGTTVTQAQQRGRPEAVAAYSAQMRMQYLLGQVPPVEPSPPPRPALLEKAVLAKVGPAAEHLSALEVARVLGDPSWAPAIQEAGACNESAGKQPHWLLAAHLSKWMAGVAYQGAPLSDVAKSFLAARPELQARFPYLDGDLVRVLQRAYPFMPQWTQSPAPATVSNDWTVLLDAAPPDPYAPALDTALTQLAEVPLSMKLTSAMADALVDKQPFAKANVVMVQHMLGQANPLVDAMARAGMDVTRAEYVGVPYQQNPAVKATLEQGHGVKVTVPEVGNIDDMWRVITEAVDRAYARHLDNHEPILVMDDGGYASKYIAEKYADARLPNGEHVFRVVEQTTRGLTEISKIPEVTHPIVDVAGSYGKRFESAQVGDAVKMAVRRVLDAVTTTPARKDVLIVGAGKVGEGVADSFHGDGARVSVFDPFITPARKRELEAKGFTVITDKAKALDKKFLVVGCSGHRSIDMADFAKMSSPVFLASASSKRVEIDTIGLGELAKDKEGQLRKILAAKVNEQETWHYFLQDGRIVTAMADGLPVNFQAVNSIAPELIDHTMSLMLLGAAQAMETTAKGLNALDPHAQFWLQAQMEGLADVAAREPPEARDGEMTLVSGERTFAGTQADWMRIATSAATPPRVLHDLLAARFEVDPMDPIALAILGSKHELLDETIAFVLDKQCLPHVGRLLQNEGVSEAQEDKLLGWLEKSFWAAAGMSRLHQNGEEIDVAKHRAVAVEQDASGAHRYLYADLVDGGDGRVHLAHRVSTVADAVTAQTSSLLFGHPRAPGYLREAFRQRTYEIANDLRASTVLRVKSEAWSGEDLDALFKDAVSAAMSRATSFGKPNDYAYAYDLLEAFRDHPSASAELAQQAERWMGEVKKLAESRGKELPRGSSSWQMSPLGIKLPEYA